MNFIESLKKNPGKEIIKSIDEIRTKSTAENMQKSQCTFNYKHNRRNDFFSVVSSAKINANICNEFSFQVHTSTHEKQTFPASIANRIVIIFTLHFIFVVANGYFYSLQLCRSGGRFFRHAYSTIARRSEPKVMILIDNREAASVVCKSRIHCLILIDFDPSPNLPNNQIG